MSNFYGFFEDVRNLYQGKIEEHGIYEDFFSKVYGDLSSITEEMGFYMENAYCVGRRILEIACGDGSNYMIPFAKKGFLADGVEISPSMIQRFEEKKSRLSTKVKNNLRIYEGDIFEFEPEDSYDLIIIPSTTICLLADDDERLKSLFQKIYSWLRVGGRFMFDYRIDQMLGNPYTTDLVSHCDNKEQYFLLMQEFNNYLPGRAVVNMYVEKKNELGETKYIASSNKRIITDAYVKDMISTTDFVLHNTYDVKSDNVDIRLLVLEKQG